MRVFLDLPQTELPSLNCVIVCILVLSCLIIMARITWKEKGENGLKENEKNLFVD